VQLLTTDRVLHTQDAEVQGITTWEHYVAWNGATERYREAQRITLYDLNGGHERTVVRVQGDARVDWVRGDGNSLVYVSAVAKEDANGIDHTKWHVSVLNVNTGQVREIAKSDSALSQLGEPSPTVSYPWVVWDTVAGAKTVDLHALNLQTGKRLFLARNISAADAAVREETVYFVKGHSRTKQDVFSMPVTGGQQLQLTHSGQVGGIGVGSAGLSYREPIAGDSRSVWFLPLEGQPWQAKAGEGSNMAVGGRFLAWLSGGKLEARSLDRAATNIVDVTDHISTVARISASANLLAFADYTLDSAGRPLGQTIHVLTVK
jgi:hypothetical protein